MNGTNMVKRVNPINIEEIQGLNNKVAHSPIDDQDEIEVSDYDKNNQNDLNELD